MPINITAVLSFCLFFCFVNGIQSTSQLKSKDRLLNMMKDKKFAISGASSYSGPNPSKKDGTPNPDIFPNAKARLLPGSGTGGNLRVFMMHPSNPNTKFPTMNVTIKQALQAINLYEVVTYPPYIGNLKAQEMLYLPSYVDSLVCTELPNFITHHLVPSGVPNDVLLTDGLSGCSVFIVTLEPEKGQKNLFQREFFCHMNAKFCGQSYNTGNIERSIRNARFINENEGGSRGFKAPRITRKVEGNGVDYGGSDLELVTAAAYNNDINNPKEEWRIIYQVQRNHQNFRLGQKFLL